MKVFGIFPRSFKDSFSPLLAVAMLVFASSAMAQSAKVGAISISNAWARATVHGMQSGGGFLVIDNAGAADRLIGVSAEVAEQVELHTMKMEGDVMKMSKVEGIDLPAGKKVELKPGSFHIMFVNLKAPLNEGDKIQLRLKFEKAGDATLVMPVKALTSGVMGH